MDLEEKARLQKYYAGLAEKELIEMILEGEKDYQEGAYALLQEEARRRGIEEKVEKICKAFEAQQKSGGEAGQELPPDEFATLFETYNNSDVAFIRSILQANDIEFFVDNESFNAIQPLATAPIIVKVKAAQLEEARELLADFQGGSFGQGKV